MALLYEFCCHRYRLTHLVAHHNNRESPSAEATGGYLLGLRQVPFCGDQAYHVQLLQQQSTLFDAEGMVWLNFLNLLTQLSYIAWQFVISTVTVLIVLIDLYYIFMLHLNLSFIVKYIFIYFRIVLEYIFLHYIIIC